MSKRIKLKSIELQNGQTLQSIIEEAKKMGVTDYSKVIIDIHPYIEHDYRGAEWPECDVELKEIK